VAGREVQVLYLFMSGRQNSKIARWIGKANTAVCEFCHSVVTKRPAFKHCKPFSFQISLCSEPHLQ